MYQNNYTYRLIRDNDSKNTWKGKKYYYLVETSLGGKFIKCYTAEQAECYQQATGNKCSLLS